MDIETVIKDMGLECSVNYIESSQFLRKFSRGDYEFEAILVKTPLPHYYNLYVKDGGVRKIVIAHELCHLEQYETGRLDTTKDYDFYWEGEFYPKSIPYDERPWEIEAFDRQNEIFKKYKKLL